MFSDSLVRLRVPSRELGCDVDVLALRPPRGSSKPAAWLWLLHGRGSGAPQLRFLLQALHHHMADGALAPHVVAAPDGPWLDRASWWVDSAYAGDDAGHGAGAAVESGIVGEVIPAVEDRLGAPSGREQRIVAGISMGGAAALRYALVHRSLFSGAALLSPAAYPRHPPEGSSARTSGAFGQGRHLFDAERFATVMGYAHLLEVSAPALGPIRVGIAVGDQEPEQDIDGEPADLEVSAVLLHAALKRRPDISSSLRVYGGGHDEALWSTAIRAAVEASGGGASREATARSRHASPGLTDP